MNELKVYLIYLIISIIGLGVIYLVKEPKSWFLRFFRNLLGLIGIFAGLILIITTLIFIAERFFPNLGKNNYDGASSYDCETDYIHGGCN